MSEQDWMIANEQHLAATLKWLRLKLQQLIPPPQAQGEISQQKTTAEPSNGWFKRNKPKSGSMLLPSPSQNFGDNDIKSAAQEIEKAGHNDPPPALLILAQRLDLSTFDRQLLALCAAMELDTRIATLCAQAQGDLSKPYPTFALAFALFDDPDWNTLSPHSPLRYWRLLEINQPGAQALTASALKVDERIVNYLKGLNYLDDRIAPLVEPQRTKTADQELPPSQQQQADAIVTRIQKVQADERVPVIELLGFVSSSKRIIADKVATTLGLTVYTIDLKTIPAHIGDLETFVRLWERESQLMPLAFYINANDAEASENITLKRFLDRSNGITFVDHEQSHITSSRNTAAFEISKPTPEEQTQLWSTLLIETAGNQPKLLAEQFSFSQQEIKGIASIALNEIGGDTNNIETALWQACLKASRPAMEKLAQRIDVKAVWNQLVLPIEQKSLLRQIVNQVNHRNRVYQDWGFREKMNRGLGINALFAGDSGTGKTMAAEVIASELKLDLFRIDLSAVVSKYIGETEKNLRKLFDAAEDSGAILFFDEADALFGKRSEVKDSHDRYANIEINYLLQRIEAYRGLAILASNMKSALDKAFVRRLRFIVDFPFPGVEEREEIWRKVFTAATPIDENLDLSHLAKFNLTGGNIHNVALNAAFLAAQEESVITMPLLFNAARTEFKKLERPMKESDFRWQVPTEVVA
ncbi:MAG: ATP-binding protein [Gammaproteobacteria bacterium]|nr:ATP-binding protein [Gammaproteobacteria bacterium]